ncbi:MAG: hypothetical protein AB7U85_01815 [Alphaproteobacteria bacterium]
MTNVPPPTINMFSNISLAGTNVVIANKAPQEITSLPQGTAVELIVVKDAKNPELAKAYFLNISGEDAANSKKLLEFEIKIPATLPEKTFMQLEITSTSVNGHTAFKILEKTSIDNLKAFLETQQNSGFEKNNPKDFPNITNLARADKSGVVFDHGKPITAIVLNSDIFNNNVKEGDLFTKDLIMKDADLSRNLDKIISDVAAKTGQQDLSIPSGSKVVLRITGFDNLKDTNSEQTNLDNQKETVIKPEQSSVEQKTVNTASNIVKDNPDIKQNRSDFEGAKSVKGNSLDLKVEKAVSLGSDNSGSGLKIAKDANNLGNDKTQVGLTSKTSVFKTDLNIKNSALLNTASNKGQIISQDLSANNVLTESSKVMTTESLKESLMFTGQVAGRTSGGQSIVVSNAGVMLLDTKTPLPLDAKVDVEVISIDGSKIKMFGAKEQLFSLKYDDNPNIKDIAADFRTLTQEAPLVSNMLAAKIPQANSSLTASVFNFINAVSNDDLSAFINNDIINALSKTKSGSKLIEKLSAEIKEGHRRSEQTKDWKSFDIPFMTPNNEIKSIKAVIRREGGGNKNKAIKADKQRFLVNFSLSRLGEMQIDTLVVKSLKRLDIILRNKQELPSGVAAGVGRIFRDTLDAFGYAGTLSFMVTNDFYDITNEENASGKTEGLII